MDGRIRICVWRRSRRKKCWVSKVRRIVVPEARTKGILNAVPLGDADFGSGQGLVDLLELVAQIAGEGLVQPGFDRCFQGLGVRLEQFFFVPIHLFEFVAEAQGGAPGQAIDEIGADFLDFAGFRRMPGVGIGFRPCGSRVGGIPRGIIDFVTVDVDVVHAAAQGQAQIFADFAGQFGADGFVLAL